ncbi:MAG: hypothetical protein JO112_07640, partial [Planctomycetes bacterium]|nr:hypothetical protein [Planctomycetota bacterium]
FGASPAFEETLKLEALAARGDLTGADERGQALADHLHHLKQALADLVAQAQAVPDGE